MQFCKKRCVDISVYLNPCFDFRPVKVGGCRRQFFWGIWRIVQKIQMLMKHVSCIAFLQSLIFWYHMLPLKVRVLAVLFGCLSVSLFLLPPPLHFCIWNCIRRGILKYKIFRMYVNSIVVWTNIFRWDFKFSWQWVWRWLSSGLCHVIWMSLPDDGGSKHLWNVDKLLPDYIAQQPRRQPSSFIFSLFVCLFVCSLPYIFMVLVESKWGFRFFVWCVYNFYCLWYNFF
jgi:hypothetical protein